MQKKEQEKLHNIQIRLPYGVGMMFEEEARQLHENLGPYLAKSAYMRFNYDYLSGHTGRFTMELYKRVLRLGNEFIKDGPADHPRHKVAQARVPFADGALIEEIAKHYGESMGTYFLKAGFERFCRDQMAPRADRLPSIIVAGNEREFKNRAARKKAYEGKNGAKS